MINVQNVQCCASSSVVLHLVKIMQHSNSVLMHIRKRSNTVSVLFKALCTLDLKPRGPAKWSNSSKIHAF